MSEEYPKIETLFRRGDDFKVTPWLGPKLPEFGLINQWLVTEKIDGTNIRVELNYEKSYLGSTGIHWSVKIKGRTERAQMDLELLAVLEETFSLENLYNAFKVDDKDLELHDEDAEKGTYGTIYGEGYGPKVQSGGWYTDDLSIRIFDVRIGPWWLNWPDVNDMAEKLDVETVPTLGLMDLGEAVALCMSGGNPSEVQKREKAFEKMPERYRDAEGVVCRTDPLLFNRKGERVMFKLKGKDLKSSKIMGVPK